MIKFEDKQIIGIKHAFFTMIFCQVSVLSKLLQSCELLKREVYNGSIDKP